MRKPYTFVLAYMIPTSVLVGLWGGGPWLLAGPLFAFVLTPALDALLGLYEQDFDEEVGLRARAAHDAWLWLWLPLQLSIAAWGFWQVAFLERTLLERLAVTGSVGLVAGAGGITIAHELMHRPDRASRALAELLMTLVSYPHFCVEHVLGHHKHVATPPDPATSRRGEALWSFLPRTLLGSLKSAWRLEGERVARRGARPFGLADRRLRMPLGVLALHAAAFAVAGPLGVAFVAGQSAVAVFLLEAVNYVEHYGLQRRLLPDGRYERVQPRHSWNSSHRLTGIFLFHLPRHADHHAHASRPYWMLRHVEDSPQLPAGYATMLLVALVPPLWRRVMDPRVDAWNARVEAELQPPSSSRPARA